MDPRCLNYCLTDSERDQFETSGYLIVEDAISPDRLNRLNLLCDRLLEEKRRDGLGPHDSFSEPNIIPADPVLLEMIEHFAPSSAHLWRPFGHDFTVEMTLGVLEVAPLDLDRGGATPCRESDSCSAADVAGARPHRP